MGRLLAFLAVGTFTGLLASVFQIPNMIPIILLILWLAMGCGLRIGYCVVGSLLLPLTVVLPMWTLSSLAFLPPDDSLSIEMFYVSGALEQRADLLTEYEAQRDRLDEAANAPIPILIDEPARPSLRAANLLAVDLLGDDTRLDDDEGKDRRPGVWPLKRAFLLGLVISLSAWFANTVTCKPFRSAGPLGLP